MEEHNIYRAEIKLPFFVEDVPAGMSFLISKRLGVISGVPLNVLIKEANNFASIHNLKILDVPNFINLIKNISSNQINEIRKDKIYFNSSEYLMLDDAKNTIYLVSHSKGPFAFEQSAKHLVDSAKSTGNIFLRQREKHILNDITQKIPLESLIYDFKNSKLPDNFTVYADIYNHGIRMPNKLFLTQDDWMKNDVVLMRSGGEESRAILGELLFKKENYSYITNTLLPITSFEQCWGGMIVLGSKNEGFYSTTQNSNGRMIFAEQTLISKIMPVDFETYLHNEYLKDMYANKLV